MVIRMAGHWTGLKDGRNVNPTRLPRSSLASGYSRCSRPATDGSAAGNFLQLEHKSLNRYFICIAGTD